MTTHFNIQYDDQEGFAYTLTDFSLWHQKSIEIRERILYQAVNLTVPIYKLISKPKQSNWEVQLENLAHYPKGTLGRAWHDFYQNVSFGITPHYETHDICHVILGYQTTIVEETRMYSFLFGSGKISPATILTLIIGCLCLPEFIPYFWQDYQLGK